MSTILKHRNQDPKVVLEKTKKYFKKVKKSDPKSKTPKISSLEFAVDKRKSTPITFDNFSKSHIHMKKLLKPYFGSHLRPVFKSKLSMGSLLCPKRRVIDKIRKNINCEN